ncbi:hypothetical protein DL770_007631 [Monosporascus sp. CRB-9-2]|nr:hypothetical protein DL770_007631 [Monosporascus sp. CRB-9-2]
MDSHKYLNCRVNVLRRIKDVKQHILRKHRKPDFYCPVCFQVFDEAPIRDNHIQERSCVSQPELTYDGISAEQRKALSNASRGKTIKEQWCDTWHVIFPDIQPPKSPYLGSYKEEMVSLFRSFWHKRQSRIISDVLKAQDCAFSDPQIVRKLMERIFDQFENEPPRSEAPDDADHASQYKMDDATGLGLAHQDSSWEYTQDSWLLPLSSSNWTGITHQGNNYIPEDWEWNGGTTTTFPEPTGLELYWPLDLSFDFVSTFGTPMDKLGFDMDKLLE